MPYSGNYISDTDVDNWPSGTTEAEKQAVIETAEATLDAVLGAPRYQKDFDIKVNGNGKNRLFIPLNARIQSVSLIEVNGTELDAVYWDFDGASVYIDMTSSGAGGNLGPERLYLLYEADQEGIFPRGYNNIRVVGKYGETVPAWAEKAAVLLAEAQNDGTLYPRMINGGETIGKYSYHLNKAEGNSRPVFITGIREVDDLIRPFVGKKKITIMAP